MKSIIATAALIAAPSAAEVLFNKNFPWVATEPRTKIVNRCSYPVYLWSIDKEQGCASHDALVLNTGETYKENFRLGTNGGISVKLSKTDTCGGKDITQLEYKIVNEPYPNDAYNGNYLDMSFVDCTENLEDCPGRTDGFYLKAGNKGGVFTSAVSNQHCPIFNVYNAEQAAEVSYINWDDPQTKWCNLGADLDLYLCGGESASDDDDDDSSAPAPSATSSSSAEASTSSSTSSSSSSSSSSSTSEEAPAPTEEADFEVAAAAAVTPAPSGPVVKTEIVYVTKFVEARHAHGRRHQHFRG